MRSCTYALVWLLGAISAWGAPPNILLIHVDDLGYGDVSSYGHPVIETPNIDLLATQGMRLTNYYAASALCSPSRAGLLTGRHPYRTGIKSWIPDGSGIFLQDQEQTLAEVLQEGGYQTALIGKWHLNSDLGSKDQPQPNDQGFDYFFGHNAFQIPTNRNPENLYKNKQPLGPVQGFIGEIYANEVIEWIGLRDTKRPFFLHWAPAEPHTPIENPQEFNERYRQYIQGKVVPIPSGAEEIPTALLEARGPGEYYANITYMDHQVGRVVSYLRNQALLDKTVVIFTSDNGPVTADWINWWEVNAYGDTGGYRGRKHDLYEGGIKVPAIVRFPPLIAPGSESDAWVIGVDWFPTLINLAGMDAPHDRIIDGVNVSPVLAGKDHRRPAYVWALSEERSGHEFAVREGDWKLMLDGNGAPRELYDMANDPLEFFNVLAQHPQRTKHLQAIYQRTLVNIEQDGAAR